MPRRTKPKRTQARTRVIPKIDLRKVKARSQIKNPITGTWTKRDDKSGKFMDVKAHKPLPFKGRKSKAP